MTERPARHWFVLQALDRRTGCPMLEARFVVEDLAAPRGRLGDAAEGDDDLRRTCFLDGTDLEAVVAAFGVAFDPGDREAALGRFWAEGVREAPYLVHTGLELALMLESRNPLAVFSDTDPSDWMDDRGRRFDMRRFDPFVAEGRLALRKVRAPVPKPWRAPDGTVAAHFQRVLYALPGEEWRMDAYLLLWEVTEKPGWNEALDRFEGSLLGYVDWQNDRWIERRRRHRREAEAALAASRG